MIILRLYCIIWCGSVKCLCQARSDMQPIWQPLGLVPLSSEHGDKLSQQRHTNSNFTKAGDIVEKQHVYIYFHGSRTTGRCCTSSTWQLLGALLPRTKLPRRSLCCDVKIVAAPLISQTLLTCETTDQHAQPIIRPQPLTRLQNHQLVN